MLTCLSLALSFFFGTVTAKDAAPRPQVRLLTGINARGLPGKTTIITSERQFARLLGKDALAKARGQVDFTREKVLWVTWEGSSSSRLSFHVLQRNPIIVSAWVETSDPALADHSQLGGLIVMPRDADWEFTGA